MTYLRSTQNESKQFYWKKSVTSVTEYIRTELKQKQAAIPECSAIV